jgi:hypothetical protein
VLLTKSSAVHYSLTLINATQSKLSNSAVKYNYSKQITGFQVFCSLQTLPSLSLPSECDKCLLYTPECDCICVLQANADILAQIFPEVTNAQSIMLQFA